jgi:hypothetical protein
MQPTLADLFGQFATVKKKLKPKTKLELGQCHMKGCTNPRHISRTSVEGHLCKFHILKIAREKRDKEKLSANQPSVGLTHRL